MRIKKVPTIILGIQILLAIALAMIKNDPELLERVFPHAVMISIKQTLFWVFAQTSVSVAEIIIFVVAIFAIGMIIWFVIMAIRKKSLSFVISFFTWVAVVLMTIHLAFTVVCGIDYARDSLLDDMGLDVRPQSVEVLHAVNVLLLEDLNTASQNVQRDENGLFVLQNDHDEMFRLSTTYFYDFLKQWDLQDIVLSTPKPVVMSEWMNYLYIAGFYFPYTGEANINVKGGDLFLATTICHERAHQYGIMPEDEANFVAFYVSVNSGDPDFIYTGYLKAFLNLSNQLYKADQALYDALISNLDPYVIADVVAYNDSRDKYRSTVGQISTTINNTYLVAQGEADGVQSYGRMADFVIALYAQEMRENM